MKENNNEMNGNNIEPKGILRKSHRQLIDIGNQRVLVDVFLDHANKVAGLKVV